MGRIVKTGYYPVHSTTNWWVKQYWPFN